ncbi:hypothetical protein XANCAGTX0491_009786 [Xanthoria calcicola]
MRYLDMLVLPFLILGLHAIAGESAIAGGRALGNHADGLSLRPLGGHGNSNAARSESGYVRPQVGCGRGPDPRTIMTTIAELIASNMTFQSRIQRAKTTRRSSSSLSLHRTLPATTWRKG